ncbi:MAG: helix-turn-helix domain-containing protein [Solirubrobacteraceae bacterium]
MSGQTPWKEIGGRLPLNPAAVEREKLKLRLALLREHAGVTQADLAERLGTTQPNVSQLESSEDLYLSSIARYVHALDGHLEVTAVIGDTSVKLVDDLADASDLVR